MAYNSATSSKAGLASIAAEPSLEDNAFHSSTVKIQYAGTVTITKMKSIT